MAHIFGLLVLNPHSEKLFNEDFYTYFYIVSVVSDTRAYFLFFLTILYGR